MSASASAASSTGPLDEKPIGSDADGCVAADGVTGGEEPKDTAAEPSLLEHIAELQQRQRQAKEERKKLAKDLRNAQRRRRRLRAKARQLSNNDLLTVLTMRGEPHPGHAVVQAACTADGSGSQASKKPRTEAE